MAQDTNEVLHKMINEEAVCTMYKKGLLFFVCPELLVINKKNHLIKQVELKNK